MEDFPHGDFRILLLFFPGRPADHLRPTNNKAGKEKIGIQFCGKLFFASWENSLRNYSLEKRPNDKRPTTMPVLLFWGKEKVA